MIATGQIKEWIARESALGDDPYLLCTFLETERAPVPKDPDERALLEFFAICIADSAASDPKFPAKLAPIFEGRRYVLLTRRRSGSEPCLSMREYPEMSVDVPLRLVQSRLVQGFLAKMQVVRARRKVRA